MRGKLSAGRLLPALGAALLLAGSAAQAARPTAPVLPTKEDSRLTQIFHADRIWNAVTTTRNGRVFVGFPQADRPGPQVQELTSVGAGRPYPDATWNEPANGDVTRHFVLVNALRIGPDGALWVVDAGAPGIGKPAMKGGARLFRIDLATDKITRTYDLASVVGGRSFVDDVRFHGGVAYLSDAGMPGLIVLDLSSGTARRVLDGDRSTTDSRPMFADGRLLVDQDGKQVRVHADQLEVAPNGATLYFQPASGPLWRIGTQWLDDPSAPAEGLASHVERFADVPTTGGTAIDARGNIYVADENRRRILRVSPAGETAIVIADPRLAWADAMWVDADGFLWIPAAQLNRAPGMNRGKNDVRYPVGIYKMKIGIGPSPIDHP